jgi:hypothetical protein
MVCFKRWARVLLSASGVRKLGRAVAERFATDATTCTAPNLRPSDCAMDRATAVRLGAWRPAIGC